jgi:Flp pilus assembly protein TadG
MTRLRKLALGRIADSRGSQILELAVCLPLLTMFMIGVIDFSGALSLKHRLALAVSQAARLGSTQPYADVTNADPASTEAIRAAVDSSLLSAKVNDCGLATAAASPPVALVWTYTANTNCPANLTLTIDRGMTFQTAGTPAITVQGVHVSISYPYAWRYGRVVQLLMSGSVWPGVTNINADAVAQNLD